MSDFRNAIRLEMESLERQLHTDPRYIKLTHLREVAALYDAGAGGQSAPQAVTTSHSANVGSALPVADRQGDSNRARALEVVDRVVVPDLPGPMRTQDILEAVQAEGIHIGGSSPVSNLSAMISRTGLYIPHGRRGWTRAQSQDDGARNVHGHVKGSPATARMRDELPSELSAGMDAASEDDDSW